MKELFQIAVYIKFATIPIVKSSHVGGYYQRHGYRHKGSLMKYILKFMTQNLESIKGNTVA
jgi:hypothetical protein